jgi:hypothetical protein
MTEYDGGTGSGPETAIEGQVAGSNTGAAPLGRRGFIVGSAVVVAGAALATAPSSVHAVDGATSYRALTPVRLCDTRPGRRFGFTRVGDLTRVEIAGRTEKGITIPADATAAVFTLIGINRSTARNFLSAFPARTAWPGTSSLNMPSLEAIVPNLVTVRLGKGGVDIRADKAADIVLDLAGVYVPSATGRENAGRFRDVSPARRVLDTRRTGIKPGAGATVRVDLTSLVSSGVIDADAAAVSVNVTAVRPSDSGFLTTYPFGEAQPETSSLNVVRGENRAIGAMVKIGRDTAKRVGFNIFVERGAHVLVDVTGYITGPGASLSTTGLFVPVDPVRLMDTRRGHGGKKRLWPGWTRAFSLPAKYQSLASSAVVNLTATRTMGPGFFTVNGAQTRVGTPAVSSLNVSGANQSVANHVVSRVTSAGLECFSQSGGDLIADLVGFYTGGRATVTAPVPVDPPPPAIGPPYTMTIPGLNRMDSGRAVVTGSATSVVDSGRIWHWVGTGWVGSRQYSVGTFGHRTDAGGPLYYVDYLGPDNRVFMSTTDQRTYVYKYQGREITSDNDAQILAATRRITNGESLAIVACTVGYDRTKSAYPNAWAPTSLRYRIVIRFTFEYWTDDIPLIS